MINKLFLIIVDEQDDKPKDFSNYLLTDLPCKNWSHLQVLVLSFLELISHF